MRAKSSEKNFWHRILSSKLILIGSLVLLFFVSLGLGKIVYKRYQIQKEIKNIQKQITSAEGDNKKLSELIEYLSTDAFREKMARQKLNLQRDGETVVSIPVKGQTSNLSLFDAQDTASDSELIVQNGEQQNNPTKWWSYFFNNN